MLRYNNNTAVTFQWKWKFSINLTSDKILSVFIGTMMRKLSKTLIIFN